MSEKLPPAVISALASTMAKMAATGEVPTVTHASVVVVHNHLGRILSVSRDGNPHDMALPGGHVEPGETPEAAAMRELHEETGVTAHAVEHLFDHDERADKVVHVYRAIATNAHELPALRAEPGEYARFADVAELKGAPSFGGFASRYADRMFTMPFVSQAQREWMHINHPGMAKRWEQHTPPGKLPQHVTADLAPSSVHVDSLGGMRRETEREKNPKIPDLSGLTSPAFVQPVPPRRADVQPFPRWPLADQTNMISAAKRRSLPDSKFALPEKNAYPIDTAARVRNAAVRLEQNKGRLTPAEYAKAKGRIGAAAKKFGIHSEYNAAETKAVDTAPATHALVPHMHVSAIIPHGGNLHVRHLSEDRTQVLALDDGDVSGGEYFGIATLLDDVGRAEGAVWNQVACVGAFRGHPAGPFELNEAVFDEIVANWIRGGRKPIPVDFEHASEAEATSGNIAQKGAPAQAWIVDLRSDPHGLYGLFDDWDPTAREYVKTKRYRFFSPAIRFGSRDKVTNRPIGARLTSGALTNQPFLDNLPSLKARTPTGDLIAAKDTGGEQVVAMQGIAESDHGHFITASAEYMPKLKAILGMHPLATPDEMKDHLDRLRDHLAKAGGNVNANVNGVSLAAYVHPMRELTHGNAAAVTVEQVLEVVEHMIDSAIAEHVEEEHGGVHTNAGYSMATAVESDKVPMATAVESDKQPAMTAVDNNTGDETTMTTMAEIQAENTRLTLAMSAKDGEIKTLNDKVTALEKNIAERTEQDQLAEVEFVMSEHADKIASLAGTDDEKRVVLLKGLQTSPEFFRATYPHENAAGPNAYLLRAVTPPAPKEDPKTAMSATGVPELDVIFANGERVEDTAERLCSEKKISFVEASEEAIRLHRLAHVYQEQTA